MSQKRPYKVIISGGGTGGHIYPAMAIANALLEKNSNTELLFVGANDRMEMQKVPAAGFKIEGLWISGIQRRLSVDNLMFPVKVISSVVKARKILKNFKADVAIGVGGYASWPLLYAANLSGIPTLIQEQNSYAGVTNKFLAKKAKKICVAYPDMEKFFPSNKIIVTGNPVRKDILEVASKRDAAYLFFGLDPNKKTILIIGGSLGARTINESIAEGIEIVGKEDVQLIWQTGKGFFEKAKAMAAPFSRTVKVFDFISTMDLAYATADIVISRAGALSISELCLVKKPVVLVPSPNVAEDHQTKNAMALVSREAAEIVKDSEARQTLITEALKLLKDNARQELYKKNISALAKPDAAKEIAEVVIEIIKQNRAINNN